MAVAGWDILSALSVGLWFHEFFKGGPQFVDKVFSNFNLAQLISFGVQAALTVVAAILAQSSPVSFVVNLVSLGVGTFTIFRIQDMHYGNSKPWKGQDPAL